MSDLGLAWQNMDTAPHDGTPLLVFHSAWDLMQIGIYDEATQSWQAPQGDLLPCPHYWMRLPVKPAQSASLQPRSA